MSKLVWKPGTLLSPVPVVMVSCGTVEKPNVITVAWTGIVNTNPAMVYISVRPERHSHKLISESGEFVIKTDKEFEDALVRAEKLMRKNEEPLSASQTKRIEKQIKELVDAMTKYKEGK